MNEHVCWCPRHTIFFKMGTMCPRCCEDEHAEKLMVYGRSPGAPALEAAKALDAQRLPTDPKARKAVPLATGCIDYFPDALAAVAELSRIGNEQHNPGKPLHWDRSKSTDEADCLIRHFVDRGKLDTDGVRHSAKVAWRALALLQKEIEDERAAVLAGG